MEEGFLRNAALEAAFGEAFSQLFGAVKNIISKGLSFDSALSDLESTLNSFSPKVRRIRRSKTDLGHLQPETKNLIKKMNQGKKLVRQCSSISRWNYLKKFKYTSKLWELDEEIKRFFQVGAPVCNATNVLEALAGANYIHVAVNNTLNRFNSAGRNAGIPCVVPQPPKFTVGLDVHVKELKMQLLKEEVSVLVLTAPGGCGKTTLVTELCHDEEIKGTFKGNIFFIRVSKTPNLKVIVDKLFSHTDYQVPEFQNDEEAIHELEQLLIQIEGSKLLVLDDVWSGSESFLRKFLFRIPNYKILVTSRTAFQEFGLTYSLETLNDKDAMKLFRHSADLKDGSPWISDKEMKEILKVCGGFPLALEVIGGSLRGKPPEAWRGWVKKRSSGCSILGSNRDLFDCLQKSFDILDDNIIKECFKDLGLFPEDQRIPVTALIDMWEELHKLDADGIGAIEKLYEINCQNLASLVLTRKDVSDVGNYYNEDFILQHDLLRELAIHQSSQEPIEERKRLIMDISGNSLPEWWTEQKLQPIKAHILSISTDEEFSSSWCNIQPSKVEVLVLNFEAKKTKNYMLPEFVAKAHELRVLIVTNYGFFCAELGNFQLLEFTPYLKKIRLEKVSIPFFCNAPIRLKSLEKISLFMCNVGHAFRNHSIQILDALPNLKEINIDYCNDLVELSNELCKIVCLEKLSITNCHKLSALPQGIEKLINLEVLRLRSCTDLWELPESIRSLNKLRILDISDCLSITKLPKHIGELHNLRKLHMEGCLRLRNQLPDSTLDLEQLELVTCDEAGAKSWESIKEDLPHLQVEVAAKDANLNWLPRS